jgi:hypothetical protein
LHLKKRQWAAAFFGGIFLMEMNVKGNNIIPGYPAGGRISGRGLIAGIIKNILNLETYNIMDAQVV